MPSLPILQVEDDEHDVFFLQHAFEKAEIPNPVQVVCDGQEAIDYLSGAASYADRARFPLPCLILLDLKMPRVSGLEVLSWLRQTSGLPPVPVIVFSSSAREDDVEKSYRLGANAFVAKPASVPDRVEFARCLKDFWLRFAELPPSTSSPPDPTRAPLKVTSPAKPF